MNILPQTFQGEVFNSVILVVPKAAPPGPNCTMMDSLWSETTGRVVANEHPETFRVSEYMSVRLFLLMNTCLTKHHPSTVNRCTHYNLR